MAVDLSLPRTRFYGDIGFYVEVRLQGSSKPNEGYIEIKPSNGTWGGICDDNFGTSEGDVICRMLGYSHSQYYKHSFGHGSGQILLDELKCTGNEDSILECPHNNWGNEYCVDSGPGHEWAGVTCKE